LSALFLSEHSIDFVVFDFCDDVITAFSRVKIRPTFL